MNPLIFVILIIMVIFTIYHFWQDISDFWNTGGTFAEGMTNKGNPIKIVSASQAKTSHGGVASRIVRALGFTGWNDRWPGGKCTHTNPSSWLKAVLDGRYDVKEVQILNRRDCCSERLKNAKVYVLDGEKKHLCGTVDVPYDTHHTSNTGWFTVKCPAEAVGNTIEVSTEDTGKHLTICGMKVFGVAPTPPAAGKYSKTENNKLCADVGKDPITTSSECKEAAGKLSLKWSNDFNGPNDHPYCLFSNDGRSKVHFNTSNTPGGAKQNYQSLCKNKPAATDAGSGNIELNQPLKNAYPADTKIQVVPNVQGNTTATAITTDNLGNTRTTTTTEEKSIDANTGAQIQKKCISVADLNSASKWVDHLFGTLGETKCANKDKVDAAKVASKMDFISGVIKGYQNDRNGSNEYYMQAITKAKPFLDQAFSGDKVKGTENNLAQSTTESISNNSSDTQAPVTNNIQSPEQPVWQDQQMAQQFSQQDTQIPQQQQQQPQMINGQILPNGFIVQKGNGSCPNGCKFPQYDNKSCEDTVFDGKPYRKCPWVKDGLNGEDCASCGAILMPKNEHGYARTAPGLFDNVSVEMAIKNSEPSEQSPKGDYYNIGKNFMVQLSKIKNFNLPNTIDTNEFISVGKLVHKYQTEKSPNTKHLLTQFINGILVTTSLSKNQNVQHNALISVDVAKSGGNFDIDHKKLTGKGANAFIETEKELKSNNRLGGSSSLYEKRISEKDRRGNGIPRDPRKNPQPYNSIWNIFNY